MLPGDDSDELTLQEAAQMLRVGPRTLQRWARDGRIPSRLMAGGGRVFRRPDLLRVSGRARGTPPRREGNGGEGPK